MTHGPTRIDSKGECIYCGSKSARLTDEHILPYFIGGQHVISKASCPDCAKITTRFERDVAKGLWGDARASYSAPSRRKKTRKKFVYLDDQHNLGKKLKIPIDDYPAPMIFYDMDTCGFLLGQPESIDHSNRWQLKAIFDQAKYESFQKKYPDQLSAKFLHTPVSFARLIAKIGYGQILCSLDPGDFRPICLPYILGNKSNLSYIVGSRKNIPEPNPGLGYVMNSFGYGTSEHIVLMAEIRIIANNHTPVYHAVIGDVSGKKNVNYALDKLHATYNVVVPDDTSSSINPKDEDHWMPRVWPLPKL